MKISAYTNLVLMTESPGSRITRSDPATLTAHERTILIVLEWQRLIDEVLVGHSMNPMNDLVVLRSSTWWFQLFDAIREIGATKLLANLQRALRVLGVPLDVSIEQRSTLVQSIEERRQSIAERIFYRHSSEDFDELLLSYAQKNADQVPDARFTFLDTERK